MVQAVHDFRGTYNVRDYRWFNLRDSQTGNPRLPERRAVEDDYDEKPAFAAYRELVGRYTPRRPHAGGHPPAAPVAAAALPALTGAGIDQRRRPAAVEANFFRDGRRVEATCTAAQPGDRPRPAIPAGPAQGSRGGPPRGRPAREAAPPLLPPVRRRPAGAARRVRASAAIALSRLRPVPRDASPAGGPSLGPTTASAPSRSARSVASAMSSTSTYGSHAGSRLSCSMTPPCTRSPRWSAT